MFQAASPPTRSEEVSQLIKAYGEQASVKELAQSFGIHRVTVTALLRRHRVELRLAGLGPEEIQGGRRFAQRGMVACPAWREVRR